MPRTPSTTRTPTTRHLATIAALALTTTLAAQNPPKTDPGPPPPPRAIPPEVTETLMAFTGFAYPDPSAIERNDDGTVASCRGSLVFYVNCPTLGELHVALDRLEGAPATTLKTAVSPHPGPDLAATPVQARAQGETDRTRLGSFVIAKPGYHRITLSTADGSPLTHLHSLVLTGFAANGVQALTRERRNAASVHLGYVVDDKKVDDVEWFYCEVTPKTDPLATFYMATGWDRGYFGMQVNSPTERRVIFSVWDSGRERDDRARVAAEDRVALVAKGDGVVAEDFGHEGTGGHSHLVRDWKVGDTFRFLLHASPDGTCTTYTGWFWSAERGEWRLIASFRAPKDGRRLHGLHSFVENFDGKNGDLARECEFGNAWARTDKGEWLPLLRAKFTHDAQGGRQRFDRYAGMRDRRFYLLTGGFLAPPAASTMQARTLLEVMASAGAHPADRELPASPPPK